ncbi:DODA-type extradiol aromatic ring-opening family dioxygenase [Nocardia aurantia]|uniref:2,3-dihydroxyphenylpropionate/2, 3-dihydroxicinnamic acid 1,2-dioxygenase n=1 Tax=Nocardia aurantia TaxID=2585199 RepID=A0A7K0DKX9_9NOCA|nr:protocatechuate 3,4-dioxygenase [Nocardia aurantia]MQY26433.1 2,3-dihydroxyphenylpropionate/2,3-dihydroxicinnamic acid 1,2-dioxygenase [Nocardia aurantia]
MPADKNAIERAVLAMARDTELLEQVNAQPSRAPELLGIDREWAETILSGNRDRLRAIGLNDGLTILVSRWFNDDLGDAASHGGFIVDDTLPRADPDVPDGVVFAGGCSHVPDLLARPEIDPDDAVARLLDGYERLRRDLIAADPDIVLVTADCHFQSFETGHNVIGTGSGHTGSMEFFKRGDLDLSLTGMPDFAGELAAAVRAAGLEVEEAERVDLDHGLIVPLRLVLPRPDLPVIPIITQPHRSFSPFNARRFGAALRGVVTRSGLKVAFLATGGLSHWLDPGHFGGVDVEFDTYILKLLETGRGLDLCSLEPYPLLEHGQYEIQNWMIMLGLIGPGVHGTVYTYEPMQASGGGWTVVNMDLARARTETTVAVAAEQAS